MKVGEGGEAFFVFETSDRIPREMQTSPLVSPMASPDPGATGEQNLEPEPLDLGATDDDKLEIAGANIERPKSAEGSSTLPYGIMLTD
jgi:phosphatidate phosphatase LPIN